MKKQKSKLRLAKKVISTLRTNSIKGGTNSITGQRTTSVIEGGGDNA